MPSYLIIGAGRVGRALHQCLEQSVLVPSRMRQTVLTDHLLTPETIVLLCCRDDALSEHVDWLQSTQREMSVVIHFTGSVSHEVLAPLRDQLKGFARAHPCRIISERATKDVFAKGVFHVTGTVEGMRAVESLARALAMTVVTDEVTDFALYHCALYFVVAENVISDAARRIAQAAGITQGRLEILTQSILHSEFCAQKPTTVGPVARGDTVTIERHLAVLRRFVPEYVEDYKRLFRIPSHL